VPPWKGERRRFRSALDLGLRRQSRKAGPLESGRSAQKGMFVVEESLKRMWSDIARCIGGLDLNRS
jgi:hypothetical protein